MELSQQRPFGNQAPGGGGGGGGGRKPTQDFLSLYGHSTIQQDPPNPPSQGGHLKTHDFLRPLERVGKTVAKEETDEISIVGKSLPLPVPAAAPPTSVEHILPGGIGTYSISHISYFNHIVPKPEGTMFSAAQAGNPDNKNEESANCGSYACGSGFTPWEESALKKGKTRKEHAGERSNTVSVREAAAKTGWTASDRPSQSSSSSHPNCFSSLSSPQPSVLKSQSFMEMIKSAKAGTHDDDLDEEEEIVLKNESPSPVHRATGESRVKVDGKSTDQKANTPRSKHSATEQRRRSKINDRFQTLRELIPHSDQKRDKASFLLEVIKHIEFLQEKVQKYEGSYQGWNQEPVKLKKNSRSEESYVGQSQGISSGAGHALLFSRTVDEKNIAISPTIPGAAQNPVDCDMSPAATFKAMDQHPGITNRAMLFPTSNIPNFFCPSRTGGAIAQCEHRMAFDAKNMTSQLQLQSCPTRPCAATGVPVATDKPKEQERTIEGGTISISSMYSQGLLNTLTQALQSSGVDLSQASISVQIELGKQVSSSPVARRSILKENEVPSNYQKTTHSRISSGEESDPAQKKLKTVTS